MKKIRVLVAIMGMDQHELGAVTVSRMLRDAGMEVIYIDKFNIPKGVVMAGIQEGVDVIGLSCHSWEYLYYIPELMSLLRERGADIPVVLGGSIITQRDRKRLQEMGVSAAFGSGTTSNEIVNTIKKLAERE